MRIAVSGTHFIGKSTLIADFVSAYPAYRAVTEPYHQLLESQPLEMALEPSFDSILAQLDCSIELLVNKETSANIIFDRCSIDFIAYAMFSLQKDGLDIHDSIVAERFTEIKNALNTIDIIAFLPINNADHIEYTEEDPAYREAIDQNLKKLYRDGIYDILPSYDRPKIVEISGEPAKRLKLLEHYLS